MKQHQQFTEHAAGKLGPAGHTQPHNFQRIQIPWIGNMSMAKTIWTRENVVGKASPCEDQGGREITVAEAC
jgi:hypothetical protein